MSKLLSEFNEDDFVFSVNDACSIAYRGVSKRTVQRKALAMGAKKQNGRYILTSKQLLAIAPDRLLCLWRLKRIALIQAMTVVDNFACNLEFRTSQPPTPPKVPFTRLMKLLEELQDEP